MHNWLTAGSFVKAIVGHYGSGKTEIALNAAVYLRNLGRKVRLSDGRRTGKIELEYYGADDREALIKNLTRMGADWEK